MHEHFEISDKIAKTQKKQHKTWTTEEIDFYDRECEKCVN